jgi:hypothetical protein
MATGDATCDSAPLQVTQFEADVVLAKQVEKFFLEGGGGGNFGESYMLPWYFAAFKTSCDSMEKRGKKGYLFTIGDECALETLTKSQIKTFVGDDVETDFTSRDLFEIASKNWNIYHIIVRPVAAQPVQKSWEALIGQERVIVSQTYENLAEIIVSTIQIAEGADADRVASSWSGKTALVVRDAVSSIAKVGDPATAAVVAL